MVGLKTALGDKALELPSEEHTESTLHLQETNASNTNNASSNTKSTTSSESTESGP